MNFPLIISMLLILPSQVLSQKEYPSKVTSRIVGGTNAKNGEFPFMASWYYGTSNTPACGGSLIAPNLVLTAAHCKNINGPIRIGCDVSTGPCLDKVNVREKIPYPSYGFVRSYDYMILELDRPVNIPDNKLINLNFSKRNDPSEGDMLTVIGFGRMKEGGAVSKHLQKINVPTVSHERCRHQYSSVLQKTHFCAGYLEGGKDSCQGDSGGPIFETSGGVTTQVGIVSFGRGCARAGYSGVYARLSGVSNWLQEEICKRAKGIIPSYCDGNETSKPLEKGNSTLSKIPTRAPTRMPTRTPTIVPTTVPNPIFTAGSQNIFSPSFPTDMPATYRPTSPAPSDGCTICSDTATPWMSPSNVECSSIKLILLEENCKLDYWIKGNYCQHSCYAAGVGYPGDYCCTNSGGTNDEIGTEDLSSTFASSTVTLVTFAPSPDPVSSQSTSTSLIESVDTNNSNDECIICDDEAISWMVASNIGCDRSHYLTRKCNKNQNWNDNKFCQLSCYNAGVGYEGDICCNGTGVTQVPTLSPTIMTTAAPTDDCTICDDIGNKWMQDVGITCKYSSLIQTKCNNNNDWRKNKFCQYSCYHTGSGYNSDNCCV